LQITVIPQRQLDNAANILNNAPRKVFGYKIPNQIWAESI